METSAGFLESATDLPAEPLLSALARDRPGIEPRLMPRTPDIRDSGSTTTA
jgi:hypothetical protein